MVSVTHVPRAAKQGNICIRNNVIDLHIFKCLFFSVFILFIYLVLRYTYSSFQDGERVKIERRLKHNKSYKLGKNIAKICHDKLPSAKEGTNLE